MKLEYKILWIENNEDTLKVFTPDVEDFLSERGFEPSITKVLDENEINDYLDTEYDLILSDFNLNETNGAVVIYNLRNVKKLDTEILFYSGNTNFLKDPEIKEKFAFMERINIHYGRDTLADKIERVIELTLKKLLEINATRGLITAVTSSLDVEIEDIVMNLIKKHKKNPDELKEIVNKKVFIPLKKRMDKFWDDYNNFGECFPKMDAVKKWEIFRGLLKPLKSQAEINTFLENNMTYQDQVIKIRNQFAHAKAIRNEQGILALKGQFGKEHFEFTEQKCIEIRKNLICHMQNIEHLKQFLNI